MIDAFIWWLSVEILGLIALPITFVLFKSLPDRGYAFGKGLSILFVSYFLWLAASLHIMPNTRWAIFLLIAALALVSILLLKGRYRQIQGFLSQNRKLVIATELIFLLFFVLWAVIRAYNSDILFGEKPMDFAFLNAVLRSEYFPPHDPWLSGYSISYYYFGYLMMAVLTKLTGIASSISFNLSLALIFALTAIGAFSILYNLVKLSRGGIKAAIGFGLVAVGLLALVGNFVGVLEMFHAHGLGSEGFWSWVGIQGLDHPYHSASWRPTDHWWWWRSTRVINTLAADTPLGLDYTITEFPFFSFLFADLHPHLMALPFVLINLGLCQEIVSSSASMGWAWLKRNWPKLLVFALCLGSLGFINTWDLPTYGFLFILAASIAAYWGRGRMGRKLLTDVAVFAAALLGFALLLYLPFYLGFQSQVSGISLVGDIDTRPFHFVLIWGLFLFVAISFLIAQAWKTLRKGNLNAGEVFWALLLPLIPLAGWSVGELAVGASLGQSSLSVLSKLWHILPLLAILSLALLVIIKKAQNIGRLRDEEGKACLFALLLLFVGFLLTMGCELFFIRDLFGIRMNTVFKLYFQAWILLALGSAFGLYYLGSRWSAATIPRKVARYCWWGIFALLAACSLIYPVTATPTLSYDFSREPTLNGLAFVERSDPAESEAIGWLNANVEGVPVIVEATGGYFTDYFRISARTGLPTILGCPGHERQWRGSDRDFRGREEDIDSIYLSLDQSQVESLFEKYGVTYVYVGRLEREQYGEDVGERFASFMDVVFENEGVTIYRVREG